MEEKNDMLGVMRSLKFLQKAPLLNNENSRISKMKRRHFSVLLHNRWKLVFGASEYKGNCTPTTIVSILNKTNTSLHKSEQSQSHQIAISE